MENAALKKYVLSSFLNMEGLAAARMSGVSGGSEFHAADPTCEARSPVFSSFYVNLLTDRQTDARTPVIISLVEVINR